MIITATRQQHSLIEEYLKTIDKPQKLIKIQSLIVETNKNPRKDFGFDWSQAGKATFALKGIGSSKNKLSEIAKVGFLPCRKAITASMVSMYCCLNA